MLTSVYVKQMKSQELKLVGVNREQGWCWNRLLGTLELVVGNRVVYDSAVESRVVVGIGC